MVHTATAVAATLVAIAFALSTFERWRARRRPHEAAWTIALVMFAVASAALAHGAGAGWDTPTFKVFYLFGAILNVPVLALGTVYLLASRRTADIAAALTALGAAFAAGVIVATDLTAALPRTELARGAEVFGPLPRILAAVASGGGALVIIAGALWSAWRRRGVLANSLIAAGTLITGASGLLNSVLDEMTGFSVTLLAGIVVLFAGFLVATAAPRPLRTPATRGAAPSPRGRAAARART